MRYSLLNVPITFGAVRIAHFGRTDAFQWEWVAPAATRTVSVDGRATFSRHNDRGIRAVITMMNTSRAYRFVYQLMDEQWQLTSGVPTAGPLPPLPFALFDTNTGDQLTALNAVFTRLPAAAKTQEVSEVRFEVFLENPTFIAGVLNVI